jgi:acetyl esterase
VQHNLSSSPKNFVNKVDHFLGKDKTLCREYIPSKTSSNKAILFFHGGGYVLNSVETHDGFVSYMTDTLQAKIYSLEYKLAPEHEYPIALNDAIEAYYWLIKKGYKPENISVCGDSAGAHLAASLTHRLIEVDNEHIPHSQFLIYPMCDPDCNSESYDFLSEGYLLTKKTMVWFWEKLGNNLNNKNDPAFNLLKLEPGIKLPNTIIITAGFDPLCDDGEKYAYLLHKRGDNVKQLHYPNMFHGFVSATRLNAAKIAVDDFLGEYKKII